jgi:hypothetical protein
VGHRRAYRSAAETSQGSLAIVKFYWTAAPMTVEGPRKGEPSRKTMRYGLRTQPAISVRGSSRRIMAMRFRPANISVINRRASAEAVIGPAVQSKRSKLTSRICVPAEAAHRSCKRMPERCSPARVRYAAPNPGAPLSAARRSDRTTTRWAAPAGTQRDPLPRRKNKTSRQQRGLTRSLHISFP